MLVFRVKWTPQSFTLDEENRIILKQILNEEWAIACVLRVNERTQTFKLISILIHRKNTAGEFSVFGKLKIESLGSLLFEKAFSHLIETGSSFTEICSDINIRIFNYVFLMHGNVKISCIKEEQPTSLENKKTIQLRCQEQLSRDFERLLSSESSCFLDVTLKCGDVSIPAHKMILSARSPVFAAMFDNPMMESRNNEVEITDIDVSTIRDLLMYIYSGKTSDLTAQSAADLLFAADKYQLPDLKSVCSYFLKDSLSPQSVWNILVLGDMHSEDLKSFAVDYVCNKCGEFSVLEKTEEWKCFRKERPDLAMELLESIVKYKDQKLKQ